MDLKRLIQSLENFPSIFVPAINDMDAADARWKPASGAWSILEVVCHLADEEVEDFRTRVHMTLREPDSPWPSIDPPQAAIDRKYNEQDLIEVRDRFLTERSASLAWLKSLDDNVDWQTAYQHAKFGPITAGKLVTGWAAHDWLHLRQITKRRFEMLARDGHPFDTSYAGDWTA